MSGLNIMKWFLRVLIFATVYNCCLASNPLEDPNICGLPTCKGLGKFKYTARSQQDYKYSVDVSTLFNGTSKNESNLHIDGMVTLNFLTPCEGILSLSEFTLSHTIPEDGHVDEHPGSADFAGVLSNSPLRFSFHDGHIEELCPQEDDPNWSLNFKRGILSMMHNTMKRFDLDYKTEEEIDVRGNCPTNYTILGAKDTSLLIQKTKDLTMCRGNARLHSIIQSTPFSFEPKQKDHIVKSQSSCTLSIDHNIYNKIECEESHLLQPFSNQNAGAATTLKQKLELQSEAFEASVNEQNEIVKRASIIFDHIPSVKPTNSELKESRNLLKKLCGQSRENMEIEFSDLFSRLIHTLRILPYPALSALYRHATMACTTGRKHMLDALPYVKTSGSVTLMKEIIVKKGIPEDTINEWIVSISFIPRPDNDMLKAVADLLNSESFHPNVALGVSSLVHTYCKENGNCKENENIKRIESYLQNKISELINKGTKDRITKDNMVVALKAVSNMGTISEEMESILYMIIEDTNLDISIRVAAVEAFRRLSCEDTRSYFENLFRNQNEDVELRISSYLQIMRCPNYLLIRSLKHTLEIEEVNQVGSFVWSHLKNILKTTVPYKVAVQSLISEKDLVQKFSSDIRKFSHNREGSIYFDEYDIGANYESNIIFSSTSYIPKTGMLNLTVDLFGESVNLLEVYGRLDGFEHYFESLFGPKGSSNNIVKDKFPKMRWTRGVDDNEVIKAEVEKLPNILDDGIDEPKVSLGFKVFGNELKYATFNGNQEILGALNNFHPVNTLKRVLSGKEINYNKAVMFLDSNYIIPSGAGLPVSLSAIGTAAVNVKLQGSLKTFNMKSKEADLSADVQPTASIDITGQMSVDAFYASTGIKLKTSMYTSSSVSGDIKVRSNKLVSLKFSLPRKKIEIFGATSELLVKQKGVDVVQKGQQKNEVSNLICSWSAMEQTVGQKLCTQYNYVNMTQDSPYFLLAGPAAFRIYLSKSDETAKTYLFEFKNRNVKDVNVITFTFDTPNSTIHQLVNFNLTMDRETQNLTMVLVSSAGKVLATGRIKNTENEKYAEFDLDINDKKHFDVSISLVRNKIKNGYNYIPKMYLGVNNEKIMELRGSVEVMSKNDVTQYALDLKFVTKRLTSKIFGYILKSDASINVDLNLDYKFIKTKEQRVSLNFSIANRSRKGLNVVTLTCKLNTTAYQNFNFDTNVKLTRGARHHDLKVNLRQNPLPDDHPDAEKLTLTFEWAATYKSSLDNRKTFDTGLIIRKPASNLNVSSNFNVQSFGSEIKLLFNVKYGNNKEIVVTGSWYHPRTTLEVVAVDFNVTVPSFVPMVVKVEIEEQLTGDWKLSFNGTWFSGHKMLAKGVYINKSKALASHRNIKLYMQSPNFKDIKVDFEYYRDNNIFKLDFKTTHDKNNTYQLFFNHELLSEEEMKTEAKIEYQKQLYTFNSLFYNKLDDRKVTVEIRIDQLRDIEFSIWLNNGQNSKVGEIEVKWDANRDPNQKLLISTNYKKVDVMHHTAEVIIGYPGRTIVGKYRFFFQSGVLQTLSSISWDDAKSLALDLTFKYDYENKVYLELTSRINTPFAEWHITNINAKIDHQGNMYDINTYVKWSNRQEVSLELFGDYSSVEPKFNCEYRCQLVSTLGYLPNWKGVLKHAQNESSYDTNVYIKTNPNSVISANSSWVTHSDNYFTNLTGTVLLTTPFNGFNKGILVSKIYMTQDKYLRGVADLDLNHKKYTTNIEAKYKKVMDSMLTINTTTPEGDYECRYLLSAEQKHLVALVTHPNGSIGAEILYQVNSLGDFDIKLFLGTPLDFLKRGILIARLKPDNAEFRAGLNTIQAGFSGVWHYAAFTDFEYVYKIYTPIENYEENGVIGRVLLEDGLELEVSVKLSLYKLGVKLVGKSKPSTLKELGIEMEQIYRKHARSVVKGEVLEDEEEDEPLSWHGLVEVDAIMYPTMKGELDIDQKGASYVLHGKLLMPHGPATILNVLDYTGLFEMRNSLEITTPYKVFKTCSSDFNINFQPGSNYLLSLNFDYENNTQLIKSGVYAKYSKNAKEKTFTSHNITFNVHTPKKMYEKLDFSGLFETDENFYHGVVTFVTLTSNIYGDINVEMEDPLLTVESNIRALTPLFQLPPTNVVIKKEFTANDNYVESIISMPGRLQKDIFCKLSWLFVSRNQFRGLLHVEPPVKNSKNITIGFDVALSLDDTTRVWTKVELQEIYIQLNSVYAKNVLHVSSDLVFKNNSYPIEIDCKLLENPSKAFDLDGTLMFKGNPLYITGNANFPNNALIILTPKDSQIPAIKLTYQLQSSINGYKLDGSIRYREKVTSVKAQAISLDKINWDINIQLMTPDKKEILLLSKFNNGKTKKDLYITANTMFPKLENCTFGLTLSKTGDDTLTEGYMRLPAAKGNFNLNIGWLFLENMKLDFDGKYENPEFISNSHALLFYKNPQQLFQFLQIGADIKIHKLIETASNVTINIQNLNDINGDGHIKLPSDSKDTHSLFGKLKYTKHFYIVEYLGNYRTDFTNKRYGSDGKVNIEDKKDMSANIGVEWKGQRYENFAAVKRSDKTMDLKYKLKTPKYIDRHLIVTELNYKLLGDRHNITGQVSYPENEPYGYTTVNYKEFGNMNGMVNVTTSYRNFRYLGAFFDTKTNAHQYDRYVRVFWHNNDAILDGKCKIQDGATLLETTTTGNLVIEIPLATRHIAHINYNYDNKPLHSKGYAIVTYNGTKALEGKYNCVSESRAGLEKDEIHLELHNKKYPLGAKYVRSHEFGAEKEAPVVDAKFINIYHLTDRSKFDVTGEANLKTTEYGQELMLSAIHLNRTIKLWTDYDVLDQEYQQHSRIELSPTVYLEYNVNLINKTVDDIFDVQQAQINISYPRRDFTIDGFYNISDSMISTDLALIWGTDRKTIEAGLEWKRAAPHREQLQFQIKHPSFERNVEFFTEYGYNKSSIDAKLVVNYSLNPDQTLTLSGMVCDTSDDMTLNYTYILSGEHNATNLNLDTRGFFYWNPLDGYGTEHYTQYRRSYLPNLREVTIGRVNLPKNEIEMRKETMSGVSYLWARYAGEFPLYTANATAIHGVNDTAGEFYLNFKKKLVYLNYNMTKDGSQSLHMHGMIPDARNAVFNIWRNYEERQISDLSYLLRLNHSRLIVSNLKWRPELINDVKSSLRSTVEQLYLEVLENINNTKQYIRSETVEVINGILQDARPLTEYFVNDLKNLTVIEEDFAYLNAFINQSYHANEFYMKDITTIVLTLFDDSALKEHLQSLPKFVQEIWDVMGESGTKIKKSLLWVVEKLKAYYKSTTEFIHKLITGDPVEHLSGLFKHIVEKYDDFIKSMHVAFIQYVERLWTKTYNMIMNNWHNTLAAIEPAFIKLAHYVESASYDIAKKLLDFLYIRKNELIESPYFARFQNFTHDLDKFYKDVKGSNSFVTIYKYSMVAWNFFKEKYLNSIPFGKELQEVIYEIYTELSQLKNIPSVKYLISKINEGYLFMKHYYDYFNLDSKIGKAISLIYFKISDVSATALDIESRHREAKTKFIFETEDGIMLLEQKLPMSWHAFNETPNFQEIPEVKAIYDLQNIFETSRISFWDFYYDYKPYTDPSEWLPPFKGQAMLVGSNHFITFDKKFYNFNGKCTYLLARDFLDKNFTLLVSYEEDGKSNELILLIGDVVVHINLFKNNVEISNGTTNHLPAQIGDTYLYRESDIVKVESSSGFNLECNMKFHMCTFQISGWYFGKTAGLWGTLNNEPSDDFLTSAKIKGNSSNLDVFTKSWALDTACKTSDNVPEKAQPSAKILKLCDEFFTNKVSYLTTCFPRISKDPYLEMCLSSTTAQEACMSAIAYINMCSYENTPLRIPDTCVKCQVQNESKIYEINEGHVIRLQGKSLPQSADIVFIVEAKACNKDLKKKKNIDSLLEHLNLELQEANLTDNRFALVVFGGDGVFDHPRSVVLNGTTFTDSNSILEYFSNIPTGDGNRDIYNAITYATSLHFRPGVSRNFILLPCTACLESNMEHDFDVIHHLVYENSVSLHILMNEHFTLEKEREIKTVFGIDSKSAYSKKDIRKLIGDSGLRKVTNLPKTALGICTSLALESDGSIFSGKFLETDKKNAKKFATVFGKRISSTATPHSCIECECTAPNTGVSYMECYHCTHPSRINVDRVMDEDDAFSWTF